MHFGFIMACCLEHRVRGITYMLGVVLQNGFVEKRRQLVLKYLTWSSRQIGYLALVQNLANLVITLNPP